MYKTPRSLTYAAMAVTFAALGAVGCTTTTTTSQGWGNQAPFFASAGRTGYVVWIQETIQRREAHPGASAAAGAAFGGLMGFALSGDAGGALLGAAGGALIGADASPRSSESASYLVVVRFDDGSEGSFSYAGWPPFEINQPVQEVAQGLVAR
jgi:outer membrane lipoprotein SlyB